MTEAPPPPFSPPLPPTPRHEHALDLLVSALGKAKGADQLLAGLGSGFPASPPTRGAKTGEVRAGHLA